MKVRGARSLAWVLGAMLVSVGAAALIPPFFLDCVVSIGYRRLVEERADDGSIKVKRGAFVPIASGFLYGDFVKKIDETRSEYRSYLVTNRHVLETIEKLDKAQIDEFSAKAKIDGGPMAYLRFNPRGTGKAREDFAAPLRKREGTFEWFHHNRDI